MTDGQSTVTLLFPRLTYSCMNVACIVSIRTHNPTHALALAHTSTQPNLRTHARARTHTHTHTHTHTKHACIHRHKYIHTVTYMGPTSLRALFHAPLHADH